MIVEMMIELNTCKYGSQSSYLNLFTIHKYDIDTCKHNMINKFSDSTAWTDL